MEKNPAEIVRADIYRRMSPTQKWEEAFRLRDIAWKIKAASIRSLNPGWDEKMVEAEVKRIFLYAVT